MSKIYTRRGDDGSTGLFGGPRVRKDDLRVAAYGEVDELNSALGAAGEELLAPAQKDILAIVDALQSELFTLGSERSSSRVARGRGPPCTSAGRCAGARSARRCSSPGRRRSPRTCSHT